MTAPDEARDKTIGAAIRAARFSRGMTQNDLAARVGITRATIASYETGRRKISAETLMQIAHLCGKPLSFFDADTQPPPAAEAPAPDPQQAAIQAIVNTLHNHPELTPFVLEFLETMVREQLVGVA